MATVIILAISGIVALALTVMICIALSDIKDAIYSACTRIDALAYALEAKSDDEETTP